MGTAEFIPGFAVSFRKLPRLGRNSLRRGLNSSRIRFDVVVEEALQPLDL